MQKLLSYGANVNGRGHDGNTALVIAVQRKDKCCVEALIKAGADPNIMNESSLTALTLAIRNGFDFTDELIRAGADVDLADKSGNTPIICAAFYGQIGMVKKLIESGCDVNHCGSEFTAVMAAAIKGHTDCVKKLIRAGADLNMQNKIGRTALMFAIEGNSDACTTALMKAGAEINTALLAEDCRKYLTSGGINIYYLFYLLCTSKLHKVN